LATEIDPVSGMIRLRLAIVSTERERVDVTLTVTDEANREATLSATLPRRAVTGNVALLAESAYAGPTTVGTLDRRPKATFGDWRIEGERVTREGAAQLGPILWSQYTLSEGLLTVSAQMPPLGPDDADTVELQVADVTAGGGWRSVGRSAIDPDARVAVFRVEGWTHGEPTDARLVYRWQGEDHAWGMTIRPEPGPDEPVEIAVFSCDHGYAFPQTPLVERVLADDPDLVFFAGDQIYEHVGGFGVARTQPVDFAILDYLRKYTRFGWTWREVLRDRPSVIIPDDHDVFHGNVWGAGGRLLEEGERPVDGGYLMPVRFVNAVQMTQTAHLPRPYDPTPTASGIGVYYTAMRLGALDLAIIEDRKWKDGPSIVEGPIYDGALLDDVQLLGARQESFLTDWMQRPAAFKVVLSQTMFAKPATHQGWELKPQPQDPDCNGWPMPARDRALEILGPNVVMLAGDQHLGMAARLGIETWDDGPLVLMAPGTANGHPRAWMPEANLDGDSAALPYTGRFVDGLGNHLRVLGVANPQPGSHKLRAHATHPYQLARQRGSGFGIARFDPRIGEVELDLAPFPAEGALGEIAGESFDGLPFATDLGAHRSNP
ncbi:MAG: alkaline phosphatase D family protein, partial [Planctomycetota bacterium]